MQINRQSYEEYFLLYADGELNESEKKAVEEFIDQNPDLAGELSILQETVFEPDSNITFENKEVLFKDESQERKVIYIRWLRMAAAAAMLIGFSLIGWIFVGEKDMHKPPVAVVKTPETKKPGPSENVSVKSEQIAGQKRIEKITSIARSKKKGSFNGKPQTNASYNIKPESKHMINEPDVVKAVPAARPIEAAAFTQDVVRTKPVKETIDVAVEPRAMGNDRIAQPQSDVSYAQSFPQEDDDMIYFANTSLTKKTKLRGVLRKATRYLDRVTSLQ